MDWIYNIILSAVRERMCGSITINFYQGGVTSVNRNEVIKEPK